MKYEHIFTGTFLKRPNRSFSPHDATDPAFGQALRDAAAAGVHVLAYDCVVTADSMVINETVKVVL